MIYSKALSDALREKLLKDKCGSSTDLDITSRFTSISIKATVDVTFTTGISNHNLALINHYLKVFLFNSNLILLN